MDSSRKKRPNLMVESKELEQFKKLANEHAVYYLLAPFAISKTIMDNSFSIGTSPPDQGRLKYSTINVDQLMKLYENGEFQDILYKSLIVHIYSIWEREYRKKIADELGQGRIESDLMGDLRYIRHAILHNGKKDLKRIKYELWRSKLQREFRITSDIIGSLQEKLNQFSVDDLVFS